MGAVGPTGDTPWIGTAGWSIPSGARERLPPAGSQLERYAARFRCAEINTSFYRPHRAETYVRWAMSVPQDFRFAVKARRTITHEARLVDTAGLLASFFAEIAALGVTLGPVLFQLPPSLKFDATVAERFLNDLRAQFSGEVVCEPRHVSWFEPGAENLLAEYRIARVAADPARCPRAADPGGWRGLRYWRLHGSPQMYFTPYGEAQLRTLCDLLTPADWCIFDNTASGAAIMDALQLQTLVGEIRFNSRMSHPGM